ncbi:hypothetical protein CH372_11950 [Leptospira meyeri]|nr:hypothetical protein CH372_11950 [Leptospira meyeri]PKA24330.1 hypothetical protein CH381_21275 [Leptospira sp. mixed culture ATI2-C-A1]
MELEKQERNTWRVDLDLFSECCSRDIKKGKEQSRYVNDLITNPVFGSVDFTVEIYKQRR